MHFSSLFIVLGVAYRFIKIFFKDYYEAKEEYIKKKLDQNEHSMYKAKKVFKRLFENPKSYIIFLGICSFIFFLVIFIVDMSSDKELLDDLVFLRLRAAETLYIIMSIICLISVKIKEVLNFDEHKDFWDNRESNL